MLAESFLSSIAYKAELWASHERRGVADVEGETWRNQDSEVNGRFHLGTELKATAKMAEPGRDTETTQEMYRLKSVQNSLPAKRRNGIPLSAPQSIPGKEQPCAKRLDLYRSWSNQSLYQNYPDLHIGGDHVADHTCDSGCVLDQCYDEMSAGPVLFSRDIPSRHSPVTNEPLQRLKAAKLCPGDDCGERTLTLHKEPLSNSVINNYMESKVQELYKQVLEEKLTWCGSITHSLVSHLLMSSLGERPRDPHAGASKALLQSLAALGLQNGSFGQSSEFATPNLQISSPLCQKKPSVAQTPL